MQIENNFFDLSSKKQNEQLNFFTDSEINENAESDTQSTTKNTDKKPTLEEYINDKDSFSQISSDNFNLKLEDYNFLWKNKDKLEAAGFKDYKIEEAVQENDMLQSTTEYWEQIDNKDISSVYLTKIEKERLQKKENNEIKSKSYQINPITKEKTDEKENIDKESVAFSQKYSGKNLSQMSYSEQVQIQKDFNKTKLTSASLDTLQNNTGLKFTAQEKANLLKRQEEQDSSIEETTGKYKFSKGSPHSSIANGRKATVDMKKAGAEGKQSDKEWCDKIDDKNNEIQKRADKIGSTRKEALQKMERANKKSEQLTQKANKALSKVGIKSIKGKKLKSKQANKGNNTETDTNNQINTNAAEAAGKTTAATNTESTVTSNNVGTTATGTTSAAINTSAAENNTTSSLVSKSEISTNNTNSVKQTETAQVQKTQENQQQDKVKQQQKQIKKENVQLVNKQKVQNNEEAKQIGKQIETSTKQSMKTTETNFKKVEQSCETLNNEKEYYIEQREVFASERHKDHGKVNRGIGETVVASSFLICGVGDICVGVAATPVGWGAVAAGVAMCIIGAGVGALGIHDINEGRKGHAETYSAGIEATVHERDSQKAADDTVKIAENDEKQSKLVDKQNIRQEKQIDDILKQSEEQEAEQRKQEEAANAAE